MPSYRGIKLSIISQCELRIHPEFAHPESSQLTHRNANSPLPSAFGKELGSKDSIESKADRLLGRRSAITVYIPSVSGQRFWIRYSLNEVASKESEYYYFKLFINGRHVTSFGAHSAKHPSGQVMKALFEPSDRWNSKQEGQVVKKEGTEARQFYFSQNDHGNSAAGDGGLIEVQVFRARGRKRRQPKLEGFRDQSKYGIFMPSGGLVEDPEDQKYYDWLLRDAKDRPFAVFKFQYRSWDFLASLHIIDENQPRQLLPPTPSLSDLNGVAKRIADFDTESSNENSSQYDVILPAGGDNNSVSSDGSTTPWNTGIFDPDPEPVKKVPRGVKSPYVIPPRTSSIAADVTHNLDELWADIKQRPLPPIPSSDNSRSHSRRSSSTGVSIASSLRSYVNRSHSNSPEPEVGIAVAMPIMRCRPVITSITRPADIGTSSTLRTAKQQNTGSPTQDIMAVYKNSCTSPESIPQSTDMANVTIRRGRRSSPERTLSRNNKKEDGNNELLNLAAETAVLTLHNTDWMHSIASPTRRGREMTRVKDEMWKSDFGEASGSGNRLRQKSLDWYSRIESEAAASGGISNDKKGAEASSTDSIWI